MVNYSNYFLYSITFHYIHRSDHKYYIIKCFFQLHQEERLYVDAHLVEITAKCFSHYTLLSDISKACLTQYSPIYSSNVGMVIAGVPKHLNLFHHDWSRARQLQKWSQRVSLYRPWPTRNINLIFLKAHHTNLRPEGHIT